MPKTFETGRIVKAYQRVITLVSCSPALLRVVSLQRVASPCNGSRCHISPCALFLPSAAFPSSPAINHRVRSGAGVDGCQPGGGSRPSPGEEGRREGLLRAPACSLRMRDGKAEVPGCFRLLPRCGASVWCCNKETCRKNLECDEQTRLSDKCSQGEGYKEFSVIVLFFSFFKYFLSCHKFLNCSTSL